jgi:hypothetical protein
LSISFVSAYASTWAQISQSKQGWKEKLRCTVCSRNSLFITFITNTSISPIIYPQSKLRLNIVLPLGQCLHSAMPCALMFGGFWLVDERIINLCTNFLSYLSVWTLKLQLVGKHNSSPLLQLYSVWKWKSRTYFGRPVPFSQASDFSFF